MMENQDKIKNEICELNFDLYNLHKKITNFQKTIGKYVDVDLTLNLYDTLTIVNDMLSSSKILNVGDTSINADYAYFTTRKTYYCALCKRDVSNKINDLLPHIQTREHKNQLAFIQRINQVQALAEQASRFAIKNQSCLSINECGVGLAAQSKALDKISLSRKFASMEVLNSPKNKPKKKSSPQKEAKKKKENGKLNDATKSFLKLDMVQAVNKMITENSRIRPTDNLLIKKNLTKLLTPHFGCVDVYIIGSRENGTALVSSDMDVYIDIDRSYHDIGIDSRPKILERLNKVIEILNATSDEWTKLRRMKKNTLKIKIFNLQVNVDCEISFTNGIGYISTELLKYFVALQPILRKMSFVLKSWLMHTGLNASITTYTLNLLIIFYLQTKHLLPSVYKLQTDIAPIEIGPWNCAFAQKTLKQLNINATDHVRRHVKGFFELYRSNKVFTNNMLSLYLGCALSNTDFVQLKREEFKRYNDFATTFKKRSELLFTLDVMNVQDPFNHACNTAKGINQNICSQFVAVADASFKAL